MAPAARQVIPMPVPDFRMKYFSIVKKSFKPDRRWLQVFLADAVYAVIIFYLSKYFVQVLETIIFKLKEINLLRLQSALSKEMAEAQAALFKAVFREVIIAFVIAIIVFIVLTILFNIFIWAKISKKETNKDFIKRFILTSVPVYIIIIFIYVLIANVYNPETTPTYLIIFTVIAGHIITAMHIAIVTSKAKHAWRRTFHFAFHRILSFIPPYLIGIVVLYVVVAILIAIKNQLQLTNYYLPLIGFLLVTVWWRIHIFDAVRYFERK